MEQKILAYLKEHETEIFEDLKSLVLTEASTSDIEALAKVREKLVMLIKERTGEDSFVYEAENGHCPVRFQYGKGTEKILFIGHYDTVHLIGALKYYTEGNELHGPGVYDMKGGLISAIWTVKAYKDLGIDPGKRLEFIFNGDEETGSAESTDIICELAKDAKAALVCEPCTANGDLKTGRKGLVRFTVRIHGKASHAGNAHKEGINAIEELAHDYRQCGRLQRRYKTERCPGRGRDRDRLPRKDSRRGRQDPQGDQRDQDDGSGNHKGSHRTGQQDADGGDGGEHGALREGEDLRREGRA